MADRVRRNPVAKSLRIMGRQQVIEDKRAKLLAQAERREGRV